MRFLWMACRRALLPAIASALVLAAAAGAHVGNLDPSFGAGGKVTTSFGAKTGAAAQAVIERGSRIVVAGQLNPSRGPSEFVLARYTRTGRLDRHFGRNGLVRTGFRGESRTL